MHPYEGNEKYIFVSYAHKDSPRVHPILQAMIHQGFRLWYDSGIEAGTEWAEYIADHLSRCETLVVFMTQAVVESKNCRNEINYALDLGKDVLVVYMDPVELTQGLKLQLNSTQSMFKYLQPSDEVFLDELFRAKILRSCRGDVLQEEESQTIPRPKSNTIISNVCSIASNDTTNFFPSGKYSSIVNRDQYQIIYFHSNLTRPFGKSGAYNVRMKIFNGDNMLVFDFDQPVEFKADHFRVSTSWRIRGDDGSFVPAGAYRAEISINYSPVFTYRFTITAPSEGIVHNPKDFVEDRHGNVINAIDASLEKRRNKCFNQISRRKGALIYLLHFFSFNAMVGFISNNKPIPGILCIILFLILWGWLWAYTRKHVHKNFLLNLLLLTIGSPFYGLFLIISGIVSLARDKEIKAELAQLSSYR